MPYAFLTCTTGVTPKMSYNDDDHTISSPHYGGHSSDDPYKYTNLVFLPRIAGVTLKDDQITAANNLISSPPCGGHSMPKIEVLEPEQISSLPCGGYSSNITKYLSM